MSMMGCHNIQKQFERDALIKQFVIALSVFYLYLLKICAMFANLKF
jgi:hypothetical protein